MVKYECQSRIDVFMGQRMNQQADTTSFSVVFDSCCFFKWMVLFWLKRLRDNRNKTLLLLCCCYYESAMSAQGWNLPRYDCSGLSLRRTQCKCEMDVNTWFAALPVDRLFHTSTQSDLSSAFFNQRRNSRRSVSLSVKWNFDSSCEWNGKASLPVKWKF